MPVSDDYVRLGVDELHVERDSRQRREIFAPNGAFLNADGLLDSVKEHGVIAPLLVTRDGKIVFGERRWTAAKLAGHTTVPVRYVDEADPLELRILELEENLRRTDLVWRDEVKSIADIHHAYSILAQESPTPTKWSIKQTAHELRLADSRVSEYLRVAEDLDSPRIAKSTSMREAYNTLVRVDERRSSEVMEEIMAGASGAIAGITLTEDGARNANGRAADGGAGNSNASTSPVLYGNAPSAGIYPVPPPGPPDSILQADFLTWAGTYSGPRFNLIHCDFPYGANVFSGPQSGRDRHTTYDDDPELYTKLIQTLCANLDRLMAHSAHLVFWLSADLDIMHKTREMFRSLAPDLVFWGKPLIWHKTDNVGVLAEPGRGPRHVYEAALVASRDDRPLVRSVSDTYGAPTDKRWHPSTKPEPVLRHFLAAFVDDNSRVLDPTCGGGSALRAAESLGAELVLGLELSDEHAKNARTAMRQFRALRSAEI